MARRRLENLVRDFAKTWSKISTRCTGHVMTETPLLGTDFRLVLLEMPSKQISWYAKTVTEALDVLNSHERGLTKEEAAKRLQEYGLNKLPEGKVDGLFLIFFRQFQSPLIYILFVAAGIVFVTGETIDALIIFTVLLFNAIVGTIQEGKAQNTLLALKKFAETSATVLRDGMELIVPDAEIISGDIIVLQEGEKVPADARIIFSNTLKVDEASLTGESEPVTKTDTVAPADNLQVADQKNMVFKGTYILSGNGMAVVVATGIKTEIGKIAQEISSIDTEIPLKTNIRYLSRVIIVTVAVISASLIVLGVLSGKSLKEMFTTAVALSVSIIPEGLPIVMTLVLATGVQRMSKRNVLVKRLQAVEELRHSVPTRDCLFWKKPVLGRLRAIQPRRRCWCSLKRLDFATKCWSRKHRKFLKCRLTIKKSITLQFERLTAKISLLLLAHRRKCLSFVEISGTKMKPKL